MREQQWEACNWEVESKELTPHTWRGLFGNGILDEDWSGYPKYPYGIRISFTENLARLCLPSKNPELRQNVLKI